MIMNKTQWVRNDNRMIREIEDAVKNTCYMSKTLISLNTDSPNHSLRLSHRHTEGISSIHSHIQYTFKM